MKSTKKTVKKNYTGGQSIKYEGNNEAPKTPQDIKEVYDNAPKGSAYYRPDKKGM